MGACLGVQLQCSCDDTVRYMSSCLCGDKNFVLSLQKHVESLISVLKEIKARREDLLKNIQVEEMKGLKRCAVVRLWLSNVQKIVLQVEDKLKHSEAEIQKLCICGYCSKSYCSSYSYSVEVWSMLIEVEKLLKERFNVVAENYVITKVMGIPIDPTISQRAMVESTWNILMEDRVGSLGLFGIPGVGKTTLLSLINNEFLNKDNDFDVVIWVVMPKDQKILTIQEEIGRRLEIYDEEWIQKSENAKAFDINRVLRNKRYALLLDDMLVKVNVIKLGVPPPDPKNKSKIVFTTRRREVCSDMAVDDSKEVTRLDDDAAWVLFREQVGNDMLRGNADIIALAKDVCEKCCGLPIVINAIGQTMARKNTLEAWQDATKSLSSIITELSSETGSSLAEFSRKEDIIMSILKFSYNNLEDVKVKRCFRYYALFPENYEMSKEEIMEYWECEGVSQCHRIFDKLVGACLLMEKEGKVKMHDMVRKMALLEARDIGEPEESIVVKTDTRLFEIPDDIKWDVLKRMSLINNQIKEISGSQSSPNLKTLLLRDQRLVNISTNFFLEMPSLLVLDLSLNETLTHLPANISKLVSLRYLNLSCTGIESLPVGLKELKQLIYLNLEHTYMLRNIVGISTLLNLRVLRLLGSRFRSDLNFIEELKCLEQISVLTISLSDEVVLKSFFGCHRLASHTQGLYIEGFATKADGISIVATSSSLQTLEIVDSNIKTYTNLFPPQESPTSVVKFEKLRKVKLYGCNGPKHLTWLLFAPNLVNLHVEGVRDIEEILSKEKAESVMKVQADLTPFKKLKTLFFEDLQGLTSIYWSPLPFTCLTKISVRRCPKLKKLPFDSESSKGRKLVIDAELDWLRELCWEDEDTKERFFPTS